MVVVGWRCARGLVTVLTAVRASITTTGELKSTALLISSTNGNVTYHAGMALDRAIQPLTNADIDRFAMLRN